MPTTDNPIVHGDFFLQTGARFVEFVKTMGITVGKAGSDIIKRPPSSARPIAPNSPKDPSKLDR